MKRDFLLYDYANYNSELLTTFHCDELNVVESALRVINHINLINRETGFKQHKNLKIMSTYIKDEKTITIYIDL